MSDRVFGAPYARLYDAMYANKDYERECDAVERAIRRHGDGGAYGTVLDLGCGTGGHAIRLARRGHAVTGVDRSEDMIAIARRKAAEAGAAVSFRAGDMRDAHVGRTFDVVLILFAALGYQTEDAAVAGTLANARRHLRRGGLLLIDVWNAPTVIREGARDRVSVVDGPGRQLVKASTRSLDPTTGIVDVRVRVWEIVGSTLAGTADETHRMRPFSADELEGLLGQGGLAARAFFEFPDLDQPVRESTFDLGCVAVAT